MIVVDSVIVIDVLRKHAPALIWLQSIASEAVAVSGYSALELFAGCHNAAEQRIVDVMLGRFEVCWPSTDHRQRALQVFKSLHLSQGIGILDTLIAETAIELGCPLCTFNVKHFQHVPDLKTIQPYQR